MSLHNLAQHVKSAGRNDDSMLVHMTPGEVAGLQKLAQSHGGSLTTNPHTGLPEAGFLGAILPTVIGAAASAVLGPEMMPLIAGGVGLADYAATGSVGQGIMAGLGAYGGGNLASGLADMGGQQLTTDAARAAVQNVTPAELPYTPNYGPELSGANSIDAEAAANTQAEALANQQQTAAQQAVNANPGATASYMDKIGAGVKAAAADPMSYLGQNWKQLAMVAAPVATSVLEPKRPTVPTLSPYSGPLSKYHLSPDFQGYTPSQPNPYYKAQGLGYAEGGLTALAPGGLAGNQPNVMFPGSQQDRTQFAESTQTPIGALAAHSDYASATNPLTGEEKPFAEGGDVTPNITQQRAKYTPEDALESMPPWQRAQARLANAMVFSNGPGNVATTPSAMNQLGQVRVGLASGGMAHGGGIGSLGGYSDGGRMLKGPGDGMSDSIPASIGGKQPARLADGEFVVPADVVSHLGNGSTDAGAKQLYAMMDKVRQARTGSKEQGKQIKPEKYLA